MEGGDPRNRDTWATPERLFQALNAEFRFQLDVCALARTAKCERFITPEQDSLSEAEPWLVDEGRAAWCNPPFSDIGPWLIKAVQSMELGTRTIVLVPDNGDTKWFHDRVVPHALWWQFRGRVRFVPPPGIQDKHGPPFGNFLLDFNPRSAQRWCAGTRDNETGRVLVAA